jgi:hypothetical protein
MSNDQPSSLARSLAPFSAASADILLKKNGGNGRKRPKTS